MEQNCRLPWLGLSLAVSARPHVCTRLVGRSCEQRGLCACLKWARCLQQGSEDRNGGVCTGWTPPPTFLSGVFLGSLVGGRLSHACTPIYSHRQLCTLSMTSGVSSLQVPATHLHPSPSAPPAHTHLLSMNLCLHRASVSGPKHHSGTTQPCTLSTCPSIHTCIHTRAHAHLHTPHLGTNGTHLVGRDTCDLLAYVPGARCDGLSTGPEGSPRVGQTPVFLDL